MSFALSAGVTGLQAHQKMLDIAGNNLANVNTTAFKSKRITFSELLSESIRKATQPTGTVGGTNPQQMGSGVGIAGITPDMAQGNIVNTGNPLDMAIEGEGYFVLSDGSQSLYTRAGAFAVDANSNLVDPATGYLVQRIGTTGEAEGFQIGGNSSIRVPYDATLPSSPTSSIRVQGNLSPDAVLTTPKYQTSTSNIAYTVSDVAATSATFVSELDQFSGTFGTTDTDGKLCVTGYKPNGDEVTDPIETGGLDISAATKLSDVLSYIDTKFGASNVTASISNGKIVVTDDATGYSKTDITLSYTGSSDGDDSLTVPKYFEYTAVGGDEVQEANITIYDSQGASHVLSGAFVRTDEANVWDMVLTSVSGSVYSLTALDRRIEGIQFNTVGSYKGITGSDTATFKVAFTYDPTNAQAITVDLGTLNKFDGLTQFATGSAGTSSAVIREQDGYESGNLTSVSINNEGVLIGAFSNGVKKDIATAQIGLFQNTSGLESSGGGYFTPSANSGIAVATKGLAGGAGTIHGGALEKSNADVASEFVTMIQAQNGFQANARTIRVANDILRELTNLIR